MKNLKKALSVMLAAAMICSLMIINAGAEYSDDSSIQNTEAVGAMSQLNIISGFPDGSFQPTTVVTRGQMCKMICVAMNGGNDPILGSDSLAIFSDTSGHWANAYISYCYNLGIVSGDAGAGGTFRPDATVTGTEAAKMMLVAMGYNSGIAGFTGAEWALNVTVAANQNGLFGGITGLNLTAGLTRDNAAQLIYNGINADMVTYNNILGTNAAGELTSTPRITALTGQTIMSEKYKAIKVEGIVTANAFTSGTAAFDGKTTLTITNTAASTIFGASSTFKFTSGANELGKAVTIYVKQSTTSPTVSLDATVIGSAVLSSKNSVYSTSAELVNTTGKTNYIKDVLSAAGLKFEDNATVSGSTVTTYNTYALTGTDTTAKTNIGTYVNANGVDAQYIDNDGDGIIEVVTYLGYDFGKVTTASTSGDGTLYVTSCAAGATNLSLTDANKSVADFADLGLAKDDYVTYYKVAASGKYYVAKAAGTTVDVTATIGTTKVVASGTTYKASSLASATDMSAASGSQANIVASVSIGKSAVFYLDKAGCVIYVTSVATTTKYLMLTTVATSTGTYGDTVSAKAVLSDGTTATITVAKLDGTKVTSTNATTIKNALAAVEIVDGNTAGVIFSYTTDSDGKYELTAQTTLTMAAPGATVNTIKANTPALTTTGSIASYAYTATATAIVVNTASPIIAEDGSGAGLSSTYTLYAGIDEVATRTNADLFAVVDASNIAKVVFTYGGSGSVSANNFMYVLSATPTTTEDSSGNPVYTYDVVRSGEVTTIVGNSSTLFGTTAGVYKVTFTGTEATGQASVDAQIVAIGLCTSTSNGVITNASGSYLYNDSTVVYLCKDGKATPSTIDAIVTTTGTSQDNVTMILGKDANAGTAEYVFICR